MTPRESDQKFLTQDGKRRRCDTSQDQLPKATQPWPYRAVPLLTCRKARDQQSQTGCLSTL
jgi:hypothetical protein